MDDEQPPVNLPVVSLYRVAQIEVGKTHICASWLTLEAANALRESLMRSHPQQDYIVESIWFAA